MVQITNQKPYNITVYELDTMETVIDRIASYLNTLPKYIHFVKGIPSISDFYTKQDDIIVEDFLQTIKDDESLQFTDFVNNNIEIITINNLNIKNDVLIPYISFNKVIEDSEEQMRGSFLFMLQMQIDSSDLFPIKPNVDTIWEDRSVHIAEINRNIANFKKNIKKTTNITNIFKDITDIPEYTPFTIQKIEFQFELDIKHITITEIFNQIKLNAYVPFATINNMYKILKDFTPSEMWGVSLDDTIIFKILQKKSIIGATIDDYTDTILTILGDPGEEKITVWTSLQTSHNYITREELIERMFSSIVGIDDLKAVNIQESKVNGVFFYPHRKFNKFVLSDLVMNDPTFSMIYIDESTKASKKKESVHIYFDSPKAGYISAKLSYNIVERGDQKVKGVDPDQFPIGSDYIRVKIMTANNINSVEIFSNILAKLLVMYEKEEKDVITFYKKFIPDFGIYKRKEQKEHEIKLKQIAPEVFVSGYPTKCVHKPRIIDEEEVKIYKMQGKPVMRYPKTDNEGFIQRNYVCDEPQAPYPGLRENPLSNNDLVPYLPCCYGKDHSKRKGSIYRHYYHDEELREKGVMEQQDMIMTNKFLTKDKYGILPDEITKILETFDRKEGYKFVRKGLFDTKSSFLDCVLEGTYEESGILEYNSEKERIKRLKQIREDLATNVNAALCKQEMYDFSIEEIMETIADTEVYMDPKLFISLLENVYDCNIIVFNRIGLKSGKIMSPRYTQSYYRTERKKKYVFIYEHMGSTSNHAKYPRCELIVSWKVGGTEEDDVLYNFEYDSEISKGIRSIYNIILNSYILNKKVDNVHFPVYKKNVELLEQNIDSYGKCRMIKFKFKRNTGMLLLNPIQPLPLPVEKDFNLAQIDKNTAIDFMAYIKGIVTGQKVVQEVLKEIHGLIGNVKVVIPVKKSKPLEGVPTIDTGITYPKTKTSILDEYNKYKKLSRYIIEYMFWLYSRYINDNNLEMDMSSVEEFYKNMVKIDKNFIYGEVEKTFSINSGVMYRGKLMIKSEESLKRLLYMLHLEIIRNREKLHKYHTRKVIKNYYVDITDFDQYQSQVILKGDNSVEKWINEQKLKYDIHSSVSPGLLHPYFFKNKLISDSIFIAQNAMNMDNARSIFITWEKDGYNLVDEDKETNIDYDINIYAYNGENDIKLYKGNNDKNQGGIIVYKIDDEPMFTVVLKIK